MDNLELKAKLSKRSLTFFQLLQYSKLISQGLESVRHF